MRDQLAIDFPEKADIEQMVRQELEVGPDYQVSDEEIRAVASDLSDIILGQRFPGKAYISPVEEDLRKLKRVWENFKGDQGEGVLEDIGNVFDIMEGEGSASDWIETILTAFGTLGGTALEFAAYGCSRVGAACFPYSPCSSSCRQ